MANRAYTQFRSSLEKKVVDVFVNFLGNTTSNPTMQSWNGTSMATTTGYNGLKSIVRNAQGDFTFTFNDTFNRLLGVSLNVLPVDGSTTPLAVAFWIKSVNTTAAGGAQVRIILYLATPGTAIDPGTNDQWYGCFTFSNSFAH